MTFREDILIKPYQAEGNLFQLSDTENRQLGHNTMFNTVQMSKGFLFKIPRVYTIHILTSASNTSNA